MKLILVTVLCGIASAQEAATHIPLQPFAQQVRQLEEALNYLGQPLSPADHQRINSAIGNPDQTEAVTQLESVLDRYTLMTVDINPESRVKVEQSSADPVLVEAGTRLFLVKVALSLIHISEPTRLGMIS